MTLESYLATADAESPFKIEVRFVAGLTERRRQPSRLPPIAGQRSLSGICRPCKLTVS